MAKFKSSVRFVRNATVLDFNAIKEESYFTDCTLGQEESRGLIAADPTQTEIVWEHAGWQIVQVCKESRKVPKPWIEAEYHRRTEGKSLSKDEQFNIREAVKAELWKHIIPRYEYSWVAMSKAEQVVIIIGKPSDTYKNLDVVMCCATDEETLGMAADYGYSNSGFDALVKSLVSDDNQSDLLLSLGFNVEFSLGHGKSRKAVAFTNFDGLGSNDHVLKVSRDCTHVTSCGFTDGEGADGDDDDAFRADGFGNYDIEFIKSKEDDEWGTVLVQLARTLELHKRLTQDVALYTVEKGESV